MEEIEKDIPDIQVDVVTLKQQAEEWALQNIGKQFQFRKSEMLF